MTGTLPPLLDSGVGGSTPERRYLRLLKDSKLLCPGKGLVLPNHNIDPIATYCRFLILSIPNNEMTRKSPFAIQKAVQGIEGDPKSVKKLCSDDLLIDTVSALQTKSFLLAKSFLDCPLTASPHISLNSSRGVISEPDLICTPEAEILEGFSGQGVIQPPQLSQTYAQTAKSSPISAATQTDENITKIKCAPLYLLQPLSYPPKPNISQSTPSVTTSSSSTQAQLLPPTSSIAATVSEPQPPTPVSNVILSSANTIITPTEPSPSIVSASTSNPRCFSPFGIYNNTHTLSKTKLQNSSTEKKKRITERTTTRI
ncbi:putative RNA-directed DNA polymerase from transposon BS [Trichonephila clavipes]|nr:putative RNA-directed DNA polymerase from transposon BS [Trichonephila clavipes]